ncbi:MAG: glycerol-3-phosphate dehydrogenase [Rhodospirillaceae bacterium]|nr:glycerol-3-phosphate dehydrogenase [Rhodospirillaceae bacterium]MBT5245719.1 glycerol-3-phosphate dehydrogenase [Rhodospirillaceae bacterium]MBT5562383.1 glycerol-3-phosphate dehydrogenase [Rhodospirillaceae bacterium]MBT7138454.1 glycerol-3-phosphate dehydrogenase [Rhodospirillaceae bacterium]
MSKALYDIAIIGGGINGCGIARDAVGRGLSVYLAEKDDLANGTSSASTKLIHGGLRYLEYYEFRLVRESLREREVLWGMAPHIIHPLRFVLPHAKDLRPAWLIRLGLFLYDHLGGRERLPGSNFVNLRTSPVGGPLQSVFTKGFEYSDCWVDDARLVVLNAMAAADKGATIKTRNEIVSAKREGQEWRLEVDDVRTGVRSTIRSRVLINASGPWVGHVISDRIAISSTSRIRLVKGSHIIVPRMFDHDRAYIFQNPDRRIIFAIPYEHDFTLVGTTDLDYSGRPEDVIADDEEVAYLCDAIGEYFSKPISPEDVVWSYSGVRPLYDDGSSEAQEATRDFVLELDGDQENAVVLNIFGGKITTYRRLAEEVLGKLKPWLPMMKQSWTSGAVLPGGDFPIDGLSALKETLEKKYAALPSELIDRLIRTYGTRTTTLLGEATTPGDLGLHFGAGLYQCEVEYLLENEWAQTVEDILWRRSKLGLRMKSQDVTNLSSWLRGRLEG